MATIIERCATAACQPWWTIRRWQGSSWWRAGSWEALFSLLDQGVVSGASFLTSVIIARCGTRHDLGTFFLAWNIVILVQAIQGDLVTSPYVVFNRRYAAADRAYYAGSTLIHQLVVIAVSCLAIALVLAMLGQGRDADLQGFRDAGLAFVFALPLLLMRRFLRGLDYAHLKIAATTLTDAIVAGVQLAGLMVLGYRGWLNVSNAYLVLGLACAVPTCVWLLGPRDSLRIDLRRVAEHWSHNWSFARWALASQLAGRATSYLLPWLLAFIHGEASTGLLAACITLVNIAGTFITGVGNYLTPKAAAAYASGGVPELMAVLRKAALVYLSVVGTFVVFLMLCGGQICGLIYGPQYAGAGALISVLAWAMLANSLSITVGNGLWAINRPDANFAADLSCLVSGLAVLGIAVYPLGCLGAACSLLVGNVVGLFVRWRTLLAATTVACPEGTRA